MRQTLDRLLDTSTPAQRCLLAVLVSVPWFCIFWIANTLAFFNADISRGIRHDVLLALQAGLSAVLLVSFVMGRWLWARRKLADAVPRANMTVATNIGLGYLILMIAAGTFTSNMSLVMLGVVAVGLLLFSVGVVLRVIILCVAIYIGQDVMIMLGWIPYAPAITDQAFEGGLPSWWWSLWRDTVFYVSWAIILGLIFLLFAKLDALHLQLAKLSYTDVLTGLSNRRYFMERLTAESRRFARSGTPYSLVLVDVDHFKSINDRYGHHAGDEVLRRLAQILIEGVRTPTDQSARIGGEEFAVLLPDTSLAATEIVCRRIADGLRRHTFNVNGEAFHLTISMGVVECRGESIEAAWQQADRNLYKAKQGGRDQAVYSTVTGVTP
ncbi:GGDEF domain-containing protein [Aquabacterium sp.]|uniref:GGDEF domain-containing protein n=1 Tax=Aquabacterium sp. TaxID=1872578 RepID=UPI003D6CF8BB